MEKISEKDLILAGEEDLEEVLALCHDVARRTPSSQWGEDYPNRAILSRDIQVRSLYKVVREGKIVSIMQIRPWEDFQKGEEAPDTARWDPAIRKPCALGRFCVSPDCQGQGLGRQVMAATLKKAGTMGYDGAFFHVVMGNEIAVGLYESMGFRRAGEIHEYGLDFYCYEMKL